MVVLVKALSELLGAAAVFLTALHATGTLDRLWPAPEVQSLSAESSCVEGFACPMAGFTFLREVQPEIYLAGLAVSLTLGVFTFLFIRRLLQERD